MTTPPIARRTVLKTGSALALAGVVPQTAQADHLDGDLQLNVVDHSLLNPNPGEFAEASIRDDGEFVVVGSFFGTNGTTLVGLNSS